MVPYGSAAGYPPYMAAGGLVSVGAGCDGGTPGEAEQGAAAVCM
jgi:hypothetical protein